MSVGVSCAGWNVKSSSKLLASAGFFCWYKLERKVCQTSIVADRPTDRQTDRQTDRRTDGQTDGQTDRSREGERA